MQDKRIKMKKIFIFATIFIITTTLLSKDSTMKISIHSNKKIILFALNNSDAAKELYHQLPLRIEIENYNNNEKIFYPPKKLSTTNTPKANANSGNLAYYAPWGDVVIFYKDFEAAHGLYELGEAIQGEDYIKELSGIVEIKAED